ncbi:hypothetical protein C8R44DRAFT_885465 [Mycena epipterygia]|nr:hypothetical protein C8R44DRAFT_885465 [Mycena epipterygia]
MPGPIVAQLAALLSQLQELDPEHSDPELEERLAALSIAAAATQRHLQNSKSEPKGGPADGDGKLSTSLGVHPVSITQGPSSSQVPATSEDPSCRFILPNVDSEVPVASEDLAAAFQSSLVLGASSAPSSLAQNFPSSADISSTEPSSSLQDCRPASAFPWVPVDLSSIRPSESAFAKPGGPRQFGMPLSGILPLEPPLHLFVWPEESISKAGKPDADKLVPAPAAPPPVAGTYPQAPEYHLNSEPDHSYRRGWRYAAPFFTKDRQIEHERMLNVQMPPNVRPTSFDLSTRSFRADPIPGMVKLPLGIPLVHHLNSDPKQSVTIACAHTLETLMQYEEGPKVQALVRRLMDLTWGVARSETHPGVPGIFELPGMKRNLRSKHVNLSKLQAGDGSYNLASTRGEGEGNGVFMPAVQTNTPEAAAIIKEVLQILHELYRLIMPLCISRFEWDMIEFNSLANNVVAFGGLEPRPTSCQLNSSSTANIVDLDLPDLDDIEPQLSPKSSIPSNKSADASAPTGNSNSSNDPPPPEQSVPTGQPGNSNSSKDSTVEFEKILLGLLNEAIGEQGGIHGDFLDDAIAYTLFVLLFRLAPGSDMGPFLLMRGAIYLHEMDVYIMFTSFKGRDLHSGSAPTYVRAIQKAWISTAGASTMFKQFGSQVRCGYVLYPSMAGTSHGTQVLYSPSLRFLHSPAPNPRDEYRRYYSLHGDTVLGSRSARANRLGLEGIYAIKNYFMQCGLGLELSVNTLLESATYTDEDGQVQRLQPSVFNIEDDEDYELICLYQRYYFWLRDLIGNYSLNLTKPKLKERQKANREIIAGTLQKPTAIPTGRNLLPKPHRRELELGSFPIIQNIINRRMVGSEAVWTVILEGSSKEVELKEQKTEWLTMEPNAQKCLQYLTKHGTGPHLPIDPEPGLANINIVPEFPSQLPATSSSAEVVAASTSRSEQLFVSAPDVPLSTQLSDLPAHVNTTVAAAETDTQHEPGEVHHRTQKPKLSRKEMRRNPETIYSDDDSDSPAGAEPEPDQPVGSVPDAGASTDASRLLRRGYTPTAAEADASRKRKRRDPETIYSDDDSSSPVAAVPEPESTVLEKGGPSRGPRRKKQKVTADEPSDSQSEEDREDYEVDKILQYRETDSGAQQWLVRWKDCDPSEDLWCSKEQLRGAQEILEEFNSHNRLPEAIFLRSPSPSSTEGSSFVPDAESPAILEKQKDNSLNSRSRRINRMLGHDNQEPEQLQISDLNQTYLRKLLDANRLQAECAELELSFTLLSKPVDFRAANDSPRTVAGRIVDQIERNNQLSTQMYFELPAGTSSGWGPRLATMTLECIADVGLSLPDMITQIPIHDLVSRGVQSQVCRALVAVYQWIVNLGPSLAAQLTSIHRHEGKDTLAQRFPDFAPMVEHVLGFVRAHQRKQELAAKSKAGLAAEDRAKAKAEKATAAARTGKVSGRGRGRGRGRPPKHIVGTPRSEQALQRGSTPTADTAAPPNDSTAAAAGDTALPDWSRIPGDLFGLLPKTRTTIPLESLGPRIQIKSDDEVYHVCAKYLCKIWEEQLILKPMIKVDQHLNPDERQTTKNDTFGDGVFAAREMKDFLHRPCKIFKGLDRDKAFARSIERDERITLGALDACLIGFLAENPELDDHCARLGDLVHRGLLSLKLGQSLSDEEYENPYQLLGVTGSFATLATASNKKKRNTGRTATDIKPTLESLLPKKPTFGIPAIIIREALSRRRGKGPTKETTVYRRMLNGEHPTTGTETRRDPDQMDPIRAHLKGFTLLKDVLPPKLWTTATGLSSLLVFMGTGQGSMTSEFLKTMKLKEDKMHLRSVSLCIDLFSSMEARKGTLGPAGNLKYYNSAIYGQANSWYSLHPSIRIGPKLYRELTLPEKFEPYFSDEIQRSWIVFLGPLANEDPATSMAPRKTWEETLRWILQSKLSGFGSGLAPLQFANNIVLAGIAEAPSPAAMAQWIFANKSYGAFAGLRVLGFQLPANASPTAVRAAFMCFYLWLDHFLTPKDKATLHFDAIFVEQLLCKIGRWKYRMSSMGGIKLDERAKEIFEGHQWQRRANWKDHTKFPFPSTLPFSLSVFRRIVEEASELLDIEDADMDEGVDSDMDDVEDAAMDVDI